MKKQHRKNAIKMIASKTEVTRLLDKMGAGVSKHDWVGVFEDLNNVWIVSYVDQAQMYVVSCYHRAWLETYSVEEIPTRTPQEKMEALAWRATAR